MEVIEIKKSIIPYEFEMSLFGGVFTFRVNHNNSAGFFTLDLYQDDEVMCLGEHIVYGRKLFADIYKRGRFPLVDIIPKDKSGHYDNVTFDNLSETVLLILDNGAEEV